MSTNELPKKRRADDVDAQNGHAQNDNDDDEEQEELHRQRRPKKMPNTELAASNLWLDTVNRHMLDFDFEKLCSVSLTNLNVYACLVCGKYFQGRGPSSHAYTHSLHEDHHVFINLESLKVFILPEGYEVTDASLSDIKHVLKPTFTKQQVAELDGGQIKYAYDLNNKKYMPGFVGLNNIKANDYVNVIVQSFAHVKPLRDYFLLGDVPSSASELVKRFGMLIRKMWNPKAFKGQVSPHELLQEITNASQKKFTMAAQSDAIEFMSWFLNTLHSGLGGTRKKSSIIHEIFQGELQIQQQIMLPPSGNGEEDVTRKRFDEAREITTTRTPFLMLALELPPAPLFTDELEKNIIPQVNLESLLRKYDGITAQDTGLAVKRFKITKLPQYLILHIKRFTKNNFTEEKNPTIVSFPIKGVDMKEYVEGPDALGETRYDLIANICHEGGAKLGQGSYKVQVHSNNHWIMIQDLFEEQIRPEMIFLQESYVQIWERKRT
ncbi:hypothetical protein SmJEL517_g04779 [Synchytrium microbalum]|uniref:USP domain-containing protein n=1 Tax=Synchytrium microbalum TaxID=1806994 RepID=A0A507C1T2_9FUNG|nr:uncharacterized protein SmJEL517_g04779 [Synchytrium microbalum]TPX32034.1 hypothetical protein SmJEL517_g04779 [Synchytrium microbalum]